MMRRHILSALLLFSPAPAIAITARNPVKIVAPFGLTGKARSDPFRHIRRGGSITPEGFNVEHVDEVETPHSPLFSIETTSDILLQLFGVINAFHGIILALAPNIGRELLGTSVEEDDDIAAYAEESVGCFAIEYGITGYLAATSMTSPEMAIGYGTLFDLYFLGKNLLNGKFKQFGVERLMIVMSSISALGTYGIFADKLHLGPVLEILTIVPAIQGAMKYFDPVGSGKKMLGTDLSDKPVAKALYRTSGQMKLVSAVLRGSIAFGVEPLRALSYSIFASATMMIDSIFVKKTHDAVGSDKALAHQLGSLAIAVVMGTVFFLSEE